MQQLNDMIENLLLTTADRPGTSDILLSLGMALILAAIVCGTYRLSNAEASYQPRFAATLLALAVISAIFMSLIRFNLALSLGMLGSLSIVRFRTNIKDPRDIGFIFWSMAVGLAASTWCFFLGLAGSGILCVCMLATRKRANTADGMMLVIRGSHTDIAKIHGLVERGCSSHVVKAKNILSDSYELVYEVHVSNVQSDQMIRGLFELSGVDSVNFLAEQRTV